MTSATVTSTAAPGDPAPKIHIFRPGRHTTMGGEQIEFSQADLDATARAYDPKLARAPLVVGHPKTDDPAQGWALSLSANDRGLYAQAGLVDPAFAESVRAGRYGAVSAKFYRPTDTNNPVPGVWYLRHIGFLGAAAPAVKGLEAPAFAAGDDSDGVCFTEGVAFSGWQQVQAASLWRSLREWLLVKFGVDEADRVLPAFKVRDLETVAAQALADEDDVPAAAMFAETQDQAAAAAGSATTTTAQETTVTEQEAQQLRDRNAELQRERDELRQRETERQAQAVQAEAVAFAEQLAAEARIPSGSKALVAAVAAQLLQQPADVEFGEGQAKQPLHQAWRGFMQALPPMVTMGEQATRQRAAAGDGDGDGDGGADVQFAAGEVDPDRADLHRRIRAHARDKNLSYTAAARAVMNGQT